MRASNGEVEIGRAEPATVLGLLEEIVRSLGFRVSRGCWTDDCDAHAFSIERWGGATYGHPKASAHYCRETGWLTWDSP